MNHPHRPLKSDTDLGCIAALVEYTGLGRSYLQALKRVASDRHTKQNPTCFTGTKSCKKWIMQWLERDENRDFKVALAYHPKGITPGPNCEIAA